MRRRCFFVAIIFSFALFISNNAGDAATAKCAPGEIWGEVEDGKKKIEVDGESYLLAVALREDFALVQAFLADYLGNLSYALTARNFNPVIAMAAGTVIVSADNIVPVGLISRDHVVTPAPGLIV